MKDYFYSKYSRKEIVDYFENRFHSFESKYSSKTYIVDIKLDGVIYRNVYAFERNMTRDEISKKVGGNLDNLDDLILDIIVQRGHILPNSLEQICYPIDSTIERNENEQLFFTF